MLWPMTLPKRQAKETKGTQFEFRRNPILTDQSIREEKKQDLRVLLPPQHDHTYGAHYTVLHNYRQNYFLFSGYQSNLGSMALQSAFFYRFRYDKPERTKQTSQQNTLLNDYTAKMSLGLFNRNQWRFFCHFIVYRVL